MDRDIKLGRNRRSPISVYKVSEERLFLSALFIFLLSFASFGQDPKIASVVHTLHKINSQVLGEQRSILVRVPINYAETDKKFPVIFMTDGHAPQNAMMVGLIEQQAWAGMIPEMIVVGIQNTNRTRDLTPTKVEGQGGGAQRFLQFIETEVIPLIENNYRTEPFRIFAGHSFGGLFAVYASVERPDLFNAYIAASPVLDWDSNFVIKGSEQQFRQKKSWKRTIYLALGNEPDLAGGFGAYRDMLKRIDPKGVEYEFRQFPDENHASVVLPAYYAGLRKIFAGWPPPQTGLVIDLEDHYKRLSERFGYTIVIPEGLLNQVGYRFLRSNKFAEAIEVFRKNVENYPQSANCYDSLAEAYEKSGALKPAKENYEKAYRLARARGDQQLAGSAHANFERISQKIK